MSSTEVEAPAQCSACHTRYPLADATTLYIEVAGGNVQLGGHQCRVQSIHRGPALTAIVTAWFCPVVYHVTLGRIHGDRGTHADITSVHEVTTRDEFDAITGLDKVRREMGWPDLENFARTGSGEAT